MNIAVRLPAGRAAAKLKSFYFRQLSQNLNTIEDVKEKLTNNEATVVTLRAVSPRRPMKTTGVDYDLSGLRKIASSMRGRRYA